MTFLKEKNFVGIFFFVNFIAALRVFSETTLFHYEFDGSLYQILRFYLENDYYFLISVFTVPLLVSEFTHEKYSVLLSLTAKCSPLIILAPWFDHFLVGQTTGYENAELTPGILLQLSLIILSVTVYVYSRTKDGFRSLIAGLGSYPLLLLIAMPEFIFPPQFDFASDLFLQFYYFIPFLIGAAVFFRWNDPDSFDALKKNLRPIRLMEGAALALAGALVIYVSGYRVHEVHVIHAAVLIFVLRSIPAGGMPLGASVVVSFSVLSFGLTLGLEAFFLSVLALILAFTGNGAGVFMKRVRGGGLAALSYFIAVYASSYVAVSLEPAMAAWSVFFYVYGARRTIS